MAKAKEPLETHNYHQSRWHYCWHLYYFKHTNQMLWHWDGKLDRQLDVEIILLEQFKMMCSKGKEKASVLMRNNWNTKVWSGRAQAGPTRGLQFSCTCSITTVLSGDTEIWPCHLLMHWAAFIATLGFMPRAAGWTMNTYLHVPLCETHGMVDENIIRGNVSFRKLS